MKLTASVVVSVFALAFIESTVNGLAVDILLEEASEADILQTPNELIVIAQGYMLANLINDQLENIAQIDDY